MKEKGRKGRSKEHGRNERLMEGTKGRQKER